MLFLSWKLFSKFIKLILLLSKKCDRQVRDKQITVPLMSTIVALLLGTKSGVALQCAGISESSSQDLLQLTNALRPSALRQNSFTLALYVPMRRRWIRMTQPRLPFTTHSKFCITDAPDLINKLWLAILTRKWGEVVFLAGPTIGKHSLHEKKATMASD